MTVGLSLFCDSTVLPIPDLAPISDKFQDYLLE